MKTEKTMEESSVDGYLEILRKYLIKNPKNLQDKLKIIIDCGKQIAKLDGKEDEIKFPRIPSCEDEENKKNNENDEKHEETEMDVDNGNAARESGIDKRALEGLEIREDEKNKESNRDEKKRENRKILQKIIKIGIPRVKIAKNENKRKTEEKKGNENKQKNEAKEVPETIVEKENITIASKENKNEVEKIEVRKDKKNEKSREIDERRVKKRKLDIITAREKNERKAKSIKSKKTEQNGEKNGNARIREEEEELSNTEIVYMQKAKSDMSTLENPVTVEDIVRKLLKEEVWKKYAEGYQIKLNDIRSMNNELKEFLRENAIVARDLEKKAEVEVVELLNMIIGNGVL